MRFAAVFVVAAAAALAGSAAAALPRPSFTVSGGALAFVAAGPRVAVATGCDVYVADLVRATKPVRLKPVGDCRSDPGDSAVDDLHLGGSTIAEQTVISPSPHGDAYDVWSGPLPAGPLHEHGDGWGWRDDEEPHGAGCAWSVAAGGGAIAFAEVPNTLAVDQGLDADPACPAGPTQRVVVEGSSRAAFTVAGSWSLLATDGRRLALARLDESGAATGELSVVDLDGKALPAPRVDPAAVRTALDGWLTPEGLVLRTKRGLVGPGWTIGTAGAYPEATVAEGRLFYLQRRTIRVRRLRDGVDRPLLTLPRGGALLAAGSFGLAIATPTDMRTPVYRLPWRTIDQVVPERR